MVDIEYPDQVVTVRARKHCKGSATEIQNAKELYSLAARNGRSFKKNAVPAYLLVQKQLAEKLEKTKNATEKETLRMQLVRNGVSIVQAWRQIDRGERFSPNDHTGRSKGMVRKNGDHLLGYTGSSYDDFCVVTKWKHNSVRCVKSSDRETMQNYVSLIRDESEELFRKVRDLRASDLVVEYERVNISGFSIHPGRAPSPAGLLGEETLPPSWTFEQYRAFYSDELTATATAIRNPKYQPPVGQLLELKNRLKVAACVSKKRPNAAASVPKKKRLIAAASVLKKPEKSASADRKSKGDVNKGAGHSNESNAGKLKRRRILEDTDEESADEAEPSGISECVDSTNAKDADGNSKGENLRNDTNNTNNVRTSTKEEQSENASKPSENASKLPENASKALINTKKINPGYMATIGTSTPRRSKSYRTLSLMEGCHVLKSIEPQVCSLRYPPHPMVECAQFIITQLKKVGQAGVSMRLGLIQFISIKEGSGSKEIKPLIDGEGLAVVLVTSGQVSSLHTGDWQVCSSETQLVTGKAEALVFNYFPAEKFHYMTSQEFVGRFATIHDGFKKTGLAITIDSGDFQSELFFKPEYHSDFNRCQSARDSLDQALSLYLDLDVSVIAPCTDDISFKEDDLKDTLGIVEKRVRVLGEKQFSLVVIANHPSGLSVVYGALNAIRTKGTCVLYLHDPLIPTVAHYYRNMEHVAVLRIVGKEELTPGSVPYTFHGYEKYLDPRLERTTPCQYRKEEKPQSWRTPFQWSLEKRRGQSIPDLLGMSDGERNAVPPLNWNTPFTVTSGLPILVPSDIESAGNMTEYFTDELIMFLLMG